jgi:hypothetical protein
MEEDEPTVGVPVQSVAPYVPPPLPSFPWGNPDLTSNRSRPRGVLSFDNTEPVRVEHPRDVRNIPIVWPDDDDDRPSYHPMGPRTEEVPSSVDAPPVPENLTDTMVEDEVPSTASSVFRFGGQTVGPHRFNVQSYHGGQSYPEEEDLDPDFNPSAPRIAEVPVMARDEGIDIEEEMLRAAIEASRREADESNMRGPPVVPEVSIPAAATGCRPCFCHGSGKLQIDLKAEMQVYGLFNHR